MELRDNNTKKLTSGLRRPFGVAGKLSEERKCLRFNTRHRGFWQSAAEHTSTVGTPSGFYWLSACLMLLQVEQVFPHSIFDASFYKETRKTGTLPHKRLCFLLHPYQQRQNTIEVENVLQFVKTGHWQTMK